MGIKIASMQLSRKLTENFGSPKYREILSVIKLHIQNSGVKGGELSRYGNAN